MARLLPIEAFQDVLRPLVGQRVGLFTSRGNVGDALILLATLQLFNEFGIRWQMVDFAKVPDVDQLVFGGGGSMGTLYRGNWELRARALALGIPLTVLPQSFNSREDRPFARVYVRERGSLRFCEHGLLAPDLALGLDYETRIPATRDLGVFLRKDCERRVPRPWLARDPARICRVPEDYLRLAAKYRRIITDRLHFAISALIVGRDTTLLPNSYHKNQSMYETWLKDLGCRFAAGLDEARRNLAEGRSEKRKAA